MFFFSLNYPNASLPGSCFKLVQIVQPCSKGDVYEYLKVFVNKVRTQIVEQSPYILVSFNGTKMESGHISRQINATWQKAGVYGEEKPVRNTSCTIFRKSASTAALEHNPEASKDVADLLLHSETTQKKYYDVRRRELSTARGAKHVGNLLQHMTIDPFGSPRRKWSAEEIEEVERLFKNCISTRMVTMETYFNLLAGIPPRKI